MSNWLMLERFVFRRDDDESFPDETKAPIRASGTTSLGARFRIAFSLAEPPLISRLYAQLPGFPDPRKQTPLAILATHRHLALIRVASMTFEQRTVQDFFIYDASERPPLTLKALPGCTEPDRGVRRRRRPQKAKQRLPAVRQAPTSMGLSIVLEPKRRLLAVKSMGLLCRGKEFVVAELNLFKPNRDKVSADICWFKSAGLGDQPRGKWNSMRVLQLGGEWNSKRVSIFRSGNPDDIWQLCLWQTHAVIPSDGWLCWVDYYRGILFCDILRKPTPTVSFLRFPLHKFPDMPDRNRTCSWLYRNVSAINAGRELKFVDVARDDGIAYGELKPGAGFTITCHTLTVPSGSKSMVLNEDTLRTMSWSKDCTLTSRDLWDANPPEALPREVLMFPQVNIDTPHVVHFLISDVKYKMHKMWLVAIDMNTGIVESFSQYINGKEDLGTVDADLTEHKSRSPKPFLPCEFVKYLS